MLFGRVSACAFLLVAGIGFVPASAQDAAEEPISFAGGTFTITETDSLEKVLAHDGRELARDYVLYFDRLAEVGGTEIALFEVGPGGNLCGPSTLIVWRGEGEELQTARAGDDCGSPPPASTGGALYFVPHPLPGESMPLQVWTPQDGLSVMGSLTFSPEPDTSWTDIDTAGLDYMLELFSNEAVYESASRRLGGALTDVASGLIVSDGVHTLSSGVLYGSGCVPHACGAANAFMAVDRDGRELYFAQQDGEGGVKTWPADEWPADIEHAMTNALVEQ